MRDQFTTQDKRLAEAIAAALAWADVAIEYVPESPVRPDFWYICNADDTIRVRVWSDLSTRVSVPIDQAANVYTAVAVAVKASEATA